MILAQKSVFDIRFEPHDGDPGEETLSSNISFSFLRTFAESLKRSLLSPDTQVQIATLQLLCHMCPVEANIESQLQELIEEGILDYIFEALRTSKNVESLVAWCIRSLSLLSAGGSAFKNRFPIGFETIIRVLESSPSTSLSSVETDALMLIAAGLPDCPGAISVARAEQLMLLLTEKLKEHASDGFALIPDTFNSICVALTALLRLPCTLNVQNAVSSVQTSIRSAILTISADIQHYCEVGTFKYIINLLQTSFRFSFKLVDQVGGCNLAELLIEACREYLVPLFAECFRCLEDQEIVFATFESLHLVLENDASDRTLRLAEKLAEASWLNISFECIAQFPGQPMKQMTFMLIRALVDKIDGHSLEEYLLQLPADPQDLLFLLEQNSSHDCDLVLAQFATIAILYTSHLCCDRLADDGQILASLEQYLLMNGSEFHRHSASPSIIRPLLCVYVWTRGALQNCGVPYSIEAEKQLLSLVERFRYEVVCIRTPKNVLLWLFHKESIQTYMVAAVLNWFKLLKDYKRESETHIMTSGTPEQLESRGSFLKDLEDILVNLVESDDCCASICSCLLERVLQNQVEDDIHTVADVLTDIARHSVLAANQLCKCDIVCNVKYWLVLYGCKCFGATICLIELLFQLLSSLSLNQIMDENIWVFLANQSVDLSIAG